MTEKRSLVIIFLAGLLTPFLAAPNAVSAAEDSAATVGYALIVTNNRSLDLSRPDLHYADDDGIQYAKLFSEVFGRERVILLTQPDVGTMQLYLGWGAMALPPTRQQLALAVERLAKAVTADKRRGRRVEVHVVFAGHGDIHAGQGFIALEDGRFTATELDEALIAKIDADYIHLIIDSCNSYFMLNPRGPGVKRWSVPSEVRHGLLEKYPKVGALISTSAEAVTYEWSELQSGIFSYEVRSALRGAADVDGQPGVSYAEAAAFVHVSSQAVVNALFRPKVFVQGPHGDPNATIMPGPGGRERLVRLGEAGERRLTIRNGDGVRVLDLHKEAGTPLQIALPKDDTPLSVYETVKDPDKPRPEVTVKTIPLAAGPVELDTLLSHSPLIASRGEAPPFRDLFGAPFGREALKTYKRDHLKPPETPFGVSIRDIERLENHLRLSSTLERKRRFVTGTLGIAIGSNIVAGQVLNAIWSDSTAGIVSSGITAGVALGYLGFGVVRFIRPTELERLQERFRNSDLSSSESRAKALVDTERRWQAEVHRHRRLRKARGVGDIVLGSSIVAGTVALAAMAPQIAADDRMTRVSMYISVGANGTLGLTVLGAGIWHLLHPSSLEAAWDTYENHRDGYRPSVGSELTVTPYPLQSGGGIAVCGRF